MAEHNYTADSIKSLDWKEHIRLRPGMYIGKLGDGSSDDDGIYVLLKEVLDNCIDEFVMALVSKSKSIVMGIQSRFGITVGEFLSRSYWIVLRKSIRVQNTIRKPSRSQLA